MIVKAHQNLLHPDAGGEPGRLAMSMGKVVPNNVGQREIGLFQESYFPYGEEPVYACRLDGTERRSCALDSFVYDKVGAIAGSK
jgi:hypothetical protein